MNKISSRKYIIMTDSYNPANATVCFIKQENELLYFFKIKSKQKNIIFVMCTAFKKLKKYIKKKTKIKNI
jgi:hypothetical protein